MTPVEKLEAAIAKLKTQKSESDDNPTPPTWHAVELGANISIVSTYADDADGEEIASEMYGPDADLIVTLHRTIDAQLSMLNDALECDRPWKLGEIGYYNRELELADAILGGGQS